ncbi:MFS transporter [Microbacterium sp. X-17]|uniref:MFS transporter n=1 Tax=Microbacterium sp. X-17 TaxID=3144404 RepID=UPI0031F4AF06
MPSQNAIIAVLALAGVSASFMFTLVVPIQAKLPELLNATRDDTAWVVTATLLSAAVVTPIAGRLGDMYGKRRIVLALLAALIVGSIIAALSAGVIGIIVGRVLQGAAVGVIPLGISILRDVLHTDRVEPAIALISATLGVGSAIGLPISAFVTENLDWHALFWLAGALGAIMFVLVLWIIPVSVLRTAGRFDYLGVVGLAAGLVGILLAVSRGSEWGWGSPATLACGLGGVVVLLVWGWYELRTPHALLDLRIAARRPVLLTNLASVALGFALFSSNVLIPQMLELQAGLSVGFGLSLLHASLIVMPAGLVMMVLSPFSGRLARTFGPRLLLVLGSTALIVAYLFVLLFHSEVWHLLVTNIMIGVGIGFGYASMPMLIMRSVPQSETGASNGLNTLFRQVGSSTAAAVVAAILASMSFTVGTQQIPTPAAFELSFGLGAIAATVALVLALFVPRARDPREQRPSLPR